MTCPPPGWHRDPWGMAPLRWWDGRQWTGQTDPGVPAAPARRGPHIVAIAGGVAAGLLVIVLIAVQALHSSSGPAASEPSAAEPTTSASPSPTPQEYQLDELEDFSQVRFHIRDMETWYQTAYEDGSIYEYVPDTDEGRIYALTASTLTTDLYDDLMGRARETNTDQAWLQSELEQYQDTADAYHERFLAGEPLGASAEITMSDGSVVVGDGTPPPPVVAAEDYDDPEEFAQDYVAYPDESGSYLPATEELAAAFGVSIDYARPYCTGVTAANPAYVCQDRPDVVYLNPDYAGYDTMIDEFWFDDTIRHEIAHTRIIEICGRLDPGVAGSRFEAVTNSYAVLFLGAAIDEIPQEGGYAMDDSTDGAARSIHEGTCS